MSVPGSFPGFIDEWRAVNGPIFTPLTYLDQDEGIPFVIAAQWLFVPHFFEYRGGVFRSVHPGERDEQGLRILDGWFDYHEGDISKIERIGNKLSLWGFFGGSDIDPYEDELLPLAKTIARSWEALLRIGFPDRTLEVLVVDTDEYGPEVTFCSQLTSNPEADTEDG